MLGWMDRWRLICEAVNERLYVTLREKNAIRESAIRQTPACHQSRDGVRVQAQKFRHLPASVENRRIHGATSGDLVRRFGRLRDASKARKVGCPFFPLRTAAKLADLWDSCQRFIRCRALPSGAKVCDLFRVQEEALPGIVPLLCPFAPDFA